MQASEADIKNHKSKGDDEAINFRPSPNFKHMRKYLKSKAEEAAFAAKLALSGSVQEEERAHGPAAAAAGMVQEEERAHGPAAAAAGMVQPPLPPNPPPPDSPLHITLKREIEDDEYQTNNEQTEQSPIDYKPNASGSNNDKDKIMCRQYARGMCTRGASCIYAHELILSQLPGIYTFCKNFQNSGCSYPKCKFVHATVFEKEYFYRTGYLPPHSLAHLKENNAPLAPPPAPVAIEGVCGPVELPSAFPNPPPAVLLSGMNAPAAVGAGGGGCAAAARPAADPLGVLAAAAAAISPRKRDWSDLDELGAPRDLDLGEPLQKKCANCDLSDLRLQYQKNKLVTVTRSAQDTNKKVALVTKKSKQLCTVVLSLLKNSNSNIAAGSNLLNNFNIRNDKEKAILDQLHLFMGNSRNSLAGEDNSKGVNLSTVLMRLLLSTGESDAA